MTVKGIFKNEEIYIISVINTLKELGMPLSEIKAYMEKCTPSLAVALLKEQNAVLEDKIMQLFNVQRMLRSKLDSLELGIQVTDFTPAIAEQEEEPVYISPTFHLPKSNIPDDVWMNFYMECKKNGILFGYPEGFLIPQKDLTEKITDLTTNIIFYLKDFAYSNSVIPKGRYLISYGHGGLDMTEKIYKNMFRYIEENDLKIIGHAYEKRLIDEVATKDTRQQLFQIKIQIA